MLALISWNKSSSIWHLTECFFQIFDRDKLILSLQVLILFPKVASKLPGEMNFKGYHDVVASSLAAPSVGGAVHPGFGDSIASTSLQ